MAKEAGLDFIRAIVEEDIKNGKNGGKVVTRFPPEPNGYLHIGHAKAICIDFGIAQDYDGHCNLRMDDTNPTAEDVEYVEGIKDDIHWLGWDWGEHFYYASDYFDQMYEHAVELIKQGKAYVDDQTADQISESRGTLTEPGVESPHRKRPVEENLALFERMKNGKVPNGAKVLRAKIDMTSPNLNLRDPVMYRVLHASHHNTGDKWCIYPMYDWAHGLEDSIERVTHSLCDLDFENHRPLYDWFLDQLGIHHPQQIEFSRLNLTYTITSKRYLRMLVEGGHVNGWDDPRMPTLRGLRRRGIPPQAIRSFLDEIGVTKYQGTTDVALLEHAIREHLNKAAPRYMAVLDPIKVVITNYPEGKVEELDAVNNPEDESAGTRMVPFSRELYIERDDFMEDAPRKFFRLTVGREVRLRYAYLVTCTDVVKDAHGNIVEIHCVCDPESRGGNAPDGRKVKGTIHWVSCQHAQHAEVRLYDRLFNEENPLSDKENFIDALNPDSLQTITAMVEPALTQLKPEDRVQFERIGYFVADRHEYTSDLHVFNRIVALRDSWAKIQKKQSQKGAKQPPQKTKEQKQNDGVNVADLIDINQFAKAKMKTARVLEAELVEGSDKLLKLQVQAGEEKRQIVAGIAKWYQPEDLVGKTVIIVANLKPAKIFGVESQGMLLAAKRGKKKLTILTTDDRDFATGAHIG